MSVAPQRLVVTGGRGRLASLVADHFRAPAFEVQLHSRQGAQGFRSLGELDDASAYRGGPSVLHLAWSTLPLTSEQNPGAEQAVDLPALRRMLAAASAAPGPERPHFVFFSTGGAVYGNSPERPSREEDFCRPIGNYGRAKLAAEEIIREHATITGLPCAILRISNPYGYPVSPARMQGIIPHALRCAMTGETLTLWGDGSAQKDFLYYADFLSALELVVARRLTGTFNICAGESHTIREVLALVESDVGRRIAVRTTPAPAWDVHDSRLSNERFVSATGWRPQVTLAEGIRRAAVGYAGAT
jgi:UDP-glucose 4-epimerase